jgi:hypothetical protein
MLRLVPGTGIYSTTHKKRAQSDAAPTTRLTLLLAVQALLVFKVRVLPKTSK